MFKLQNTEWKEDATELADRLTAMASHADRPLGERSACWASALLLGQLCEELEARIGKAGGEAAPAAPAAKPADGHRHKYGPDGRCTLMAPGGSGICTAVARAAKKAEGAPPVAPAGGGSSS